MDMVMIFGQRSLKIHSGLKNDRDNHRNDLQKLRDKLADLEKALRQ